MSQQASATVKTLTNELSTSADDIEAATKNVSGASGLLTAVSSVSASLSKMSQDFTKAWNDLKALKGQGKSDLESAFKSSSACTSLQTTVSSG